MTPHIKTAIRVAQKSTHRCFFHGAVLIRAGSIISTGYNKNGRHAEMAAILSVFPSERKDCTLVSVRVTKGLKLSSAKPCINCLTALKENGIKKIYYSTAERTIEEIRL